MPACQAPSMQRPRPVPRPPRRTKFFSSTPPPPSETPSLFSLFTRSTLQLFPPRQPLRNLLLEPEGTGLVEPRPLQTIGQVLLRDVCLGSVVRVLIPLVIPQFLHECR